jgi:hypothetical protein
MSVLIGSICDRCGKGYGLPVQLWPGRHLCPCCDLAVPVWERNRYTREQAAA